MMACKREGTRASRQREGEGGGTPRHAHLDRRLPALRDGQVRVHVLKETDTAPGWALLAACCCC